MTKNTHAKYIAAIAILGATIVWLATKSLPEASENDEIRTEITSIAVLPFIAHGGDDSSERLAATITSNLVDELSESSQFSVVSATAATAVTGRQLSIREIGDELLVSHVIEGGVQVTLGKLRIVIQLIDARNDEHVWAETYQLDADDLSSFATSAGAKISSMVR